MWYEWIFSGIGTTILSGIGGIIIGSIGGYQIGIRGQGKQVQKAKDGTKQQQEMEVQAKNTAKKVKSENSIKQIQKAGNNSEQIQIGSVESGE